MRTELTLFIQENTLALHDSSRSNLKYFSDVEHLIQDCRSHPLRPIQLQIDTPNAEVKYIDTSGMSIWHKYKLRAHLLSNLEGYDLVHLMSKKSGFVRLRANFPQHSKTHLELLQKEGCLIASVQSSLLSLLAQQDQTSHEQYVVTLPLNENYHQCVLFSKNIPQLVHTCHNPDIKNWTDFVTGNQRIPILHHKHAVNVQQTPLIFLTKCRPIKTRLRLQRLLFPNTLRNRLKHAQTLMITLSALLVSMTASDLFLWNSASPKLLAISQKQHDTRSQIEHITPPQHTLSTQQLTTFQNFLDSQFPLIAFFTQIAPVLKKFGQINAVHLTPHKTNPKHFKVAIHITPKKPQQLKLSTLTYKFPKKLSVSQTTETTSNTTLYFEGQAHDFFPSQK